MTRMTEAAFNALTPAQVAVGYDVVIITWNSNPGLDVDWNTRLVPMMAAGVGVIYDGDYNTADLAPGVIASTTETGGGGIVVSAAVPGLTDGIANSFINNHISFSSWDPALSPFLSNGGRTVGLYGSIGAGCIVLTGPDQDFHGFRGAGGNLRAFMHRKNCIPPAPCFWVRLDSPTRSGPTHRTKALWNWTWPSRHSRTRRWPPAVCMFWPPSAMKAAASTTSCVAVPAVRETQAGRASICRSTTR